jgi:hypothetical protein
MFSLSCAPCSTAGENYGHLEPEGRLGACNFAHGKRTDRPHIRKRGSAKEFRCISLAEGEPHGVKCAVLSPWLAKTKPMSQSMIWVMHQFESKSLQIYRLQCVCHDGDKVAFCTLDICITLPILLSRVPKLPKCLWLFLFVGKTTIWPCSFSSGCAVCWLNWYKV